MEKTTKGVEESFKNGQNGGLGVLVDIFGVPGVISSGLEAPGRLQERRPRTPGNSKVAFWAENGAQRADLGPPWGPKMAPKSHF